VLISGHVGLLEERRFRELGAASVVKKPFGLDELTQIVLAVVEDGDPQPQVPRETLA